MMSEKKSIELSVDELMEEARAVIRRMNCEDAIERLSRHKTTLHNKDCATLSIYIEVK